MSKEEKIINEFFDSEGFETAIYVKVEEKNTIIQQKIGTFKFGIDGVAIELIDGLGSIIFSMEDNNLYFSSFDEKFYTPFNITSDITLMSSKNDESNSVNIKDYIINIESEYNIISFEIDLKEMVYSELSESEKEQISEFLDIETIKCKAKVEKGKIVEFSINMDSFLKLVNTSAIFNSIGIEFIMKDIKYDPNLEVVPNVHNSFYEYKSNEDFLLLILSKFYQEDSNNSSNNNNKII